MMLASDCASVTFSNGPYRRCRRHCRAESNGHVREIQINRSSRLAGVVHCRKKPTATATKPSLKVIRRILPPAIVSSCEKWRICLRLGRVARSMPEDEFGECRLISTRSVVSLAAQSVVAAIKVSSSLSDQTITLLSCQLCGGMVIEHSNNRKGHYCDYICYRRRHHGSSCTNALQCRSPR